MFPIIFILLLQFFLMINSITGYKNARTHPEQYHYIKKKKYYQTKKFTSQQILGKKVQHTDNQTITIGIVTIIIVELLILCYAIHLSTNYLLIILLSISILGGLIDVACEALHMKNKLNHISLITITQFALLINIIQSIVIMLIIVK